MLGFSERERAPPGGAAQDQQSHPQGGRAALGVPSLPESVDATRQRAASRQIRAPALQEAVRMRLLQLTVPHTAGRGAALATMQIRHGNEVKC